MVSAGTDDCGAKSLLVTILQSVEPCSVAAYLRQMRCWARQNDIDAVQAVFDSFGLGQPDEVLTTLEWFRAEELLSALLQAYPSRPTEECDACTSVS